MSDHGLLLGAGEQKSDCVGAEEPPLVATDRSRKYPCPGSSTRLLVTDRPYVICHRGEIGSGELGTTHGGHHTSVLLGVWYAVGDRPGDRLDAAIAP